MSAEARVLPGALDERRTALARLEADGLIVSGGQSEAGQWKTGRRWQQAMARAAVKLYDEGDPGDDLRIPIVLALFDLYGLDLDDESLAVLVEAMLPIEIASLGLASIV